MTEHNIPGAGPVSFSDSIPVTPSHHINATVTNIGTAEDITVRYWMMLDTGELKLSAHVFRAVAGAQTSSQIQLTYGRLLAVQVNSEFSDNPVGMMYCFVNVRQGQAGGTGPIGFKTLISDYVAQSSALTWPWVYQGMQPDRFALWENGITSPAAGANFQYTIPSYTYFRPLSVRARLTCDATVANRRVKVILRDAGSNSMGLYITATNQTASQVRTYHFTSGLTAETTDVLANPSIACPLPDLRAFPGWILEVSVSNIQAGDQLDNIQLAAMVQAVAF